MKRFVPSVLLLLVCLAPAWAQTADEKKETIAWLQKLQQPDGGFVLTPAPPAAAKPEGSTLRATSTALRALRYFGGEPKDHDAAVKYVERAFDKDSGGFSNTQPELKPDAVSTAVGLMAIVELKMPQEKYADAAVKYLTQNAKEFEEVRMAAAGLEAVGKTSPKAGEWVEQVKKTRNADGSWGKGDSVARDTGGTAVLVLRLGGKLEHDDTVVKALKAGQRDDGGFGKEEKKESDLETTYRVMRAFRMLREKPADVEKLKGFVAKCRNADAGYGVSPGTVSNGSGTYFAAIIMHWLDEK
jgi:prenyltransferase beta subunit